MSSITIFMFSLTHETVNYYHTICKAPDTPNGYGTTFVYKFKNVLARCEVAAKHALYIKFKRCTQRPYSVHITFPQRRYSVYDAHTARMK